MVQLSRKQYFLFLSSLFFILHVGYHSMDPKYKWAEKDSSFTLPWWGDQVRHVTSDTSYYLFAQFFSLLLTHLHSITCVLHAQVFWMPLGPFEAQSSCPYFSESNRSQEKHFLYGRLADFILCLYSITQENNKTSLSREPINGYEICIMRIWIDHTCTLMIAHVALNDWIVFVS